MALFFVRGWHPGDGNHQGHRCQPANSKRRILTLALLLGPLLISHGHAAPTQSGASSRQQERGSQVQRAWGEKSNLDAKLGRASQPVFLLAQGPAPAAATQVGAPSAAAAPATAPVNNTPATAQGSGGNSAAASGELDRPASPSEKGPIVPAATPVPSDPAQRLKWLESRIEQVVAAVLPSRAKVAIAVLDVDSGRALYGKAAEQPFNIASNVKLFTTAAALSLLGPEYRFKTALYGERGADRSEYKTLYLRGYGDPTLSTEDLWKLTTELSARGIKRIKGDIVIDDTFFDDQRVGPAFEQKNQDSAYRAPQGGVSLNYNAIAVRVLPGIGDGLPARISLDPPSQYFLVSNEARTVASGRTSLIVDTQEEKDAAPGKEHTSVRVRGTIKLSDSGVDFNKRIAHPDLYTGYTLLELLTRRGIAVGGKVSRGSAPATAQLIDSHYSMPLSVVSREINKRSNNFMAEQVLKTLGADANGKPGSWQKGLQAISRYLEALGIAPGKYQMVNGSGLFDSNRFTATQVTTLLRAAYRDFRFAADFVASLAVAGADGTIGHRMSGGPAERLVRAKTGTLNGISCLSGCASAPQPAGQSLRAPLAFSILVNDLNEEGSTTAAKRLQDAVVEALVSYQSSASAAVATPTPAAAGTH